MKMDDKLVKAGELVNYEAPQNPNGWPNADPQNITYSMIHSATDLAVYVVFRIPENITFALSKDEVIEHMHRQLLKIFAERK